MPNGHDRNTPAGFKLAIVGREKDYGYLTAHIGAGILLARVHGYPLGQQGARAIESAVSLPPVLDSVVVADYACRLAEFLDAEPSYRGQLSVSLLALQPAVGGLTGWIIGCAEVWSDRSLPGLCAPGQSLKEFADRMGGTGLEAQYESLVVSGISSMGVLGGGGFFAPGFRFLISLGYPLLGRVGESVLAEQSDAKWLAALVCARGDREQGAEGLVGVWNLEQADAERMRNESALGASSLAAPRVDLLHDAQATVTLRARYGRQTNCGGLAEIVARVQRIAGASPELLDRTSHQFDEAAQALKSQLNQAAMAGAASILWRHCAGGAAYRFVITAGCYHPVDSSERAFRRAGELAATRALELLP